MITGNTAELDEAIRSKILPYLYNGGEGKWIHCAHLACLRNRDRPKSKQFDEIKVNNCQALAQPQPNQTQIKEPIRGFKLTLKSFCEVK